MLRTHLYKTSKIGLNEVRKFFGGFEPSKIPFLSNHQCWCRTTTKNTTRRMAAAFSRLAVWNCGQMFSTIVTYTRIQVAHESIWSICKLHYHKLTLAMITWVLCPTIYIYIAFANYIGSQKLLESSWQLWRNQRKGRKTLQPSEKTCCVVFSLTAARELCTCKVAVTTIFCGVLNGGRCPIFPIMLP